MQFEQKVIEIVKKIPRGKVATYKEVAILCGRSKAYRSVGNILNKNYKENGPKIPCHRVIRSDGEIGRYALGKKRKKELLKKEGVKISNNFIQLKPYSRPTKNPV
jgi:O-6-methylguanine DNA methyltransferase